MILPKKNIFSNIRLTFLVLVNFGLYFLMVNTDRNNIHALFAIYFALFLVYVLILNNIFYHGVSQSISQSFTEGQKNSVKLCDFQTLCNSVFKKNNHLLLFSILFRLVFLLSTPSLSDDYARFVWDGQLVAHGQNPYLFTPNQIVQTNDSLFSLLNSPNYFSVYSPINQGIFGACAYLADGDVEATVILLRLCIILADVVVILLLSKISPSKVFLYALNPLVIIELSGNLHFEVFTILFIVIFLTQSSTALKLTSFTMATSIKFVPLIFLPSIVKQIGWRKGLVFAMIVILLNIAFFIPFYDSQIIKNISSSFDLYFQKFEFNASLYYLLRYLGIKILGYNPIQFLGPMLAIFSGITILWIAFWSKFRFVDKLILSLSVYYLCTTTVHPWYILPMVALSVFSEMRFAIVWSATIFLSYWAYQTAKVSESSMVLLIEYGVVLIYFWKYDRKNSTT